VKLYQYVLGFTASDIGGESGVWAASFINENQNDNVNAIVLTIRVVFHSTELQCKQGECTSIDYTTVIDFIHFVLLSLNHPILVKL
jgi:hypothetical protein